MEEGQDRRVARGEAKTPRMYDQAKALGKQGSNHCVVGSGNVIILSNNIELYT